VGLEQKPEGCLIQLREQDDGIPIRKPSPVTTKKLGKLTILMEETLPGDRRCTRQCQTHEDYVERGNQ
jgi:hypothetical protein